MKALSLLIGLALLGSTARVMAKDPAEEIPFSELPTTTAPKVKSKKTADSVNLILLGTRDQIFYVFEATGWKTADRIGLKSSTQEVLASLEKKSYLSAPVSTQYLFHRRQDFAFELEEGNARKRHHVRFWEMPDHPNVWVGAATEDIGLLIKPTRGVISHRVNPDVDLEREFVVQSLLKSCTTAIHRPRTRAQHLSRLNAQGIRYFTDGELGILSAEGCLIVSGPS